MSRSSEDNGGIAVTHSYPPLLSPATPKSEKGSQVACSPKSLEIGRKVARVAPDSIEPLQQPEEFVPYVFMKQSYDEVDLLPDLWAAASSGDVARLKEIKQSHKNISLEEVDMDLRTPLHLVAARGHLEAARFLLSVVRDISPCDRRGHTPIMVAYNAGHDQVAALLEEAITKRISLAGTWSCENDPGTLVLFHDLQRLGSHLSHTTYGQTAWYTPMGRHNYDKFFELIAQYGIHVVSIQDIILASMHHPDFREFIAGQIQCEVQGASNSRVISVAGSAATAEEISAFKQQLVSGMSVEQIVLAVTHRITITLARTDEGDLATISYKIEPMPNLLRGRMQICTSKGVVLVGCQSCQCEINVLKWCFQRVGLPIIAELPDPLRMTGRDFVPAGPDLCFMGTGTETENAAVAHMISQDVFGTPRVAVVRDLFKRGSPLESHFKLISSTHCVLSDDVDLVQSRRLVTEYVVTNGASRFETKGGIEGVVLGRYAVSQRDVPFKEYLTKLGYQIVELPAKYDISLCVYSMGNGKLLIADPEVYEILRAVPQLPCEMKQGFFTGVAVNYQYLYKSSLMFRRPETGTALAVPPAPAVEPPYTTWSSIRDPNPRQTTYRVLMVAPVGFQSNVETAMDNFFMKHTTDTASEIEKRALREFAQLRNQLVSAGVDVVMFSAERFHGTPDAVFPNNWFTTHPASELGQSTVVFYPMKTVTRRNERRQNIMSQLQSVYDREFSFTMWETSDFPHFLEGTGVLVMDRVNKVAYAALSQRCYEKIASAWATKLRYRLVSFRAVDIQGRPIYHTNVMMSVGSSLAVVCLACVSSAEERRMLVDSLNRTGHTVVDITMAQVDEFCGNVLELASLDGRRLLVMSSRSYGAFTSAQREVILAHVDEIVHADIATIETIGGGGVRCMLAELF